MPTTESVRLQRIAGGRCPARLTTVLPCPGRLLPASSTFGDRMIDEFHRYRCNGPAAHELEIRELTSAGAVAAAPRLAASGA